MTSPFDDGAGEGVEWSRGSKKGEGGVRDGEALLPSPVLYTSPEPAAAAEQGSGKRVPQPATLRGSPFLVR